MHLVLLTALGVGGATIFGAGIGFIFKNLSHKFSDIVLAFAAISGDSIIEKLLASTMTSKVEGVIRSMADAPSTKMLAYSSRAESFSVQRRKF